MKGVVFELLRSGAILVGMLAAAAIFLAIGAWVIALIIATVTVLGAICGAVIHPKQLMTAMHPKSVRHASATPVSRHKQAWLMLDDKSGRELAVELRSRRIARSIGAQTIPVTVAGALEPGSWVVVQTLGLTIWPVGKVEEGMPRGASHDLKRMRASWRDMMR
jgi:hypothetical protein